MIYITVKSFMNQSIENRFLVVKKVLKGEAKIVTLDELRNIVGDRLKWQK